MGVKEDIKEVKEEIQDLKAKSWAMDILSDYKKQNKRQFIIILVILTMWFATVGYLIYIMNDIGTIEETTTQQVEQENENGNNNFIGGNGDINNGKAKDKANKDN